MKWVWFLTQKTQSEAWPHERDEDCLDCTFEWSRGQHATVLRFWSVISGRSKLSKSERGICYIQENGGLTVNLLVRFLVKFAVSQFHRSTNISFWWRDRATPSRSEWIYIPESATKLSELTISMSIFKQTAKRFDPDRFCSITQQLFLYGINRLVFVLKARCAFC
jgi:hypothetical protein